MDIEGGELLALEGAINIVRTHHPILLLEVSLAAAGAFGYKPSDLMKFLYGLDYRMFSVKRNKLKPLLQVQELDYENLICLPNDTHEYPSR